MVADVNKVCHSPACQYVCVVSVLSPNTSIYLLCRNHKLTDGLYADTSVISPAVFIDMSIRTKLPNSIRTNIVCCIV